MAKRRVADGGFDVSMLEGADGPATATYHDQKTGKEFPHLPVDAWSLSRYIRRGWMLGPAPEKLRKKWASRKPTVRLEEQYLGQANLPTNEVAELRQEVQELKSQLTELLEILKK